MITLLSKHCFKKSKWLGLKSSLIRDLLVCKTSVVARYSSFTIHCECQFEHSCLRGLLCLMVVIVSNYFDIKSHMFDVYHEYAVLYHVTISLLNDTSRPFQSIDVCLCENKR